MLDNIFENSYNYFGDVMFKNKNNVEKFSNFILLVMVILSVLSLLMLLFNGYDTELSTHDEYINSIAMNIIYAVIGGAMLLVTNKFISLYKNEYATSRRVFNLLLTLSLYSILVEIFLCVTEYIIFDNLNLIVVLSILLGNIVSYIVAFKVINKGKLLSTDNDTKTNATNFAVIYLLIEYYIGLVVILLNISFGVGDIIILLKKLCLSLIFICVILMAYKMSNENGLLASGTKKVTKDAKVLEDKNASNKKTNKKN